MKMDIVIRIIILLVSLAVASYLAVEITPYQEKAVTGENTSSIASDQELDKFLVNVAHEKQIRTKAPIAGLHKFFADIAWMRFINYTGGLSSVDKNNVGKVGNMLKAIIAYDPNFPESYKTGILSISNADPKLAVEILDEACYHNEQLKNNVQIPFYAGFILSRTIIDQTDPEGKPLSTPDYGKAKLYFEEAIKRSSPPEPYIVSNYIRAKAKEKMPDEENSYAILSTLYEEWTRQKSEKTETMYDTPCLIPDLESRLIKAARDAAHPTDDNGKPVKPSEKAQQLIAKVHQAVFSKNHLCPNCLTPTAPGDRYCANCGKPITVWGICPVCGASLKNGNAAFCSQCGKKQ